MRNRNPVLLILAVAVGAILLWPLAAITYMTLAVAGIYRVVKKKPEAWSFAGRYLHCSPRWDWAIVIGLALTTIPGVELWRVVVPGFAESWDAAQAKRKAEEEASNKKIDNFIEGVGAKVDAVGEAIGDAKDKVVEVAIAGAEKTVEVWDAAKEAAATAKADFATAYEQAQEERAARAARANEAPADDAPTDEGGFTPGEYALDRGAIEIPGPALIDAGKTGLNEKIKVWPPRGGKDSKPLGFLGHGDGVTVLHPLLGEEGGRVQIKTVDGIFGWIWAGFVAPVPPPAPPAPPKSRSNTKPKKGRLPSPVPRISTGETWRPAYSPTASPFGGRE